MKWSELDSIHIFFGKDHQVVHHQCIGPGPTVIIFMHLEYKGSTSMELTYLDGAGALWSSAKHYIISPQ